MMIKKCGRCGYTMSLTCKICGAKTRLSHPSKFSLSDKYAKYRRIIKDGNQ